jgi:hypothetical protein
VSISSTFYVQLLLSQIPKALKDTYDLAVFCTLIIVISSISGVMISILIKIIDP